jgi:glycosyltransferase involved in cell wall biosynthesis
MHLCERIVLSLDWLVALSWLLRVLTWRHGLASVPDLTRNPMQSSNQGRPLPRLTVVAPARNEGGKIGATLESLLRSKGVALEVIAVDDRSEDRTGAIIDELASRDDRMRASLSAEAAAGTPVLRALHVAELPPGWLGKTHAMACGAREASGEWLLFTDGDVLFAPNALSSALAYAVASKADHLVLMPTLLMEGWGERAMMAFLQVMSLWAVRLWRIADPKSFDALGVGAFNLIRRETYDAIGGWERFRMDVVEDLALGFRVKRQGFAQRAVLGPGLVSVRWVEGAFGIVGNLAKNLFAFFRYRAWLLIGFLPVYLLLTIFPFAAAGALLAPRGGALAAGAASIMLLALWLAYQRQGQYQNFSPWQMLFFPAASLVILYTMVRSMAVVLWRRGILWRGTYYPLSELRRQAQK